MHPIGGGQLAQAAASTGLVCPAGDRRLGQATAVVSRLTTYHSGIALISSRGDFLRLLAAFRRIARQHIG